MSARICGECGTSNNDSRVYCMDCGARLPETSEATPASSAPPEFTSAGVSAPPLPTASYRTSVRKGHIKQAKARRLSLSAELLLLAILGFALACLIQALRVPDAVGAPAARDDQAAEKTFANLEKCATSPTLATWTLNVSAINQFLASDVPPTGGAADPRRALPRAFTITDFGSLEFFVERTFLGRSVYFSLEATPVSSGGKLQAKVTGGTVGRLPVPSFLMQFLLPQFDPALKRLAPAIELARTAQSIAINPTDITLQWPGAGTNSP